MALVAMEEMVVERAYGDGNIDGLVFVRGRITGEVEEGEWA